MNAPNNKVFCLPGCFSTVTKNRISGELPYGYKTLVCKSNFSKICNSTQSEWSTFVSKSQYYLHTLIRRLLLRILITLWSTLWQFGHFHFMKKAVCSWFQTSLQAKVTNFLVSKSLACFRAYVGQTERVGNIWITICPKMQLKYFNLYEIAQQRSKSTGFDNSCKN